MPHKPATKAKGELLKRKLNAMDLAFLSLEKQTTPVNVGSLSIFETPQGYEGNFARDVIQKLEVQLAGEPFNLKLSSTNTALLPSWVADEHFDIHYHVRHSALPKPGTTENLLELVSRIHSRLLDRERPLWEFYFIEGLEGNRFAIYIKMHHACIDGMGGIELMKAVLTTSPSQQYTAPWVGLKKGKNNKQTDSQAWTELAAKLKEDVSEQVQTVKDVSNILLNQGLKAVGIKDNIAPAPFTAPTSMFNVPIGVSRCFAIKNVSLSEIKAVGKQANATVNDIILAMCSGALRKYMREKGNLPRKSLVAMVPVSVRQMDKSGNQITYITSDLATNEMDTMTRLAKVAQSTAQAKQEIEGFSSTSVTGFAVVAQGLVAALNQFGVAANLPPHANVTISNVPGPSTALYFGEAKLVGTYPLSVLIDGQSLNITVISYCDTVSFGLLGCRETIPDINTLAAYIGDAFEGIKAGIFLRDLMRKG